MSGIGDGFDPAALPTAQRRARFEMARMALPGFPDAHAELFQDWLRMLPIAPDASSPDPVAGMRAALTGDLGRVRWEADTSSAAIVDPFLTFCHEWGADDDALATLGAIGERLDPPALGTWVESRGDGFDLGWALTGRWSPSDLATLLPVPAGLDDELIVRRIAQSLATGAPTTRLRIDLPGDDQAAQAANVLEALDAPMPGDGALGVVLNMADGDLGLSLWTLDDGVAATGLVVAAPSLELVVALARALGTTDALDTIAEFGALLLVEAPAELELRIRSSGDEFELTYDIDLLVG